MPLQGLEGRRHTLEERIATAGLGQRDIEDADLGLGGLADPAAHCRAQQLVPEADAHERQPALDRGSDRALLDRQPGMLLLLPHVHRSAHDPQRIVAVERRNPFARIEFDGVPGDAVGR